MRFNCRGVPSPRLNGATCTRVPCYRLSITNVSYFAAESACVTVFTGLVGFQLPPDHRMFSWLKPVCCLTVRIRCVVVRSQSAGSGVAAPGSSSTRGSQSTLIAGASCVRISLVMPALCGSSEIWRSESLLVLIRLVLAKAECVM